MDLSLVLACYNEGPTLARSVETIRTVLDATRLTYELIFVDDASRDGTPDRIREIVQRSEGRPPMRVLWHERNTGRGGAVRDGLRLAQGELVGYLDVDLEIPAHAILACVLALRDGYEVAVGKRIYPFQWRSLDRFVLSKGYAWLVGQLLRLPGLTDTESGCKFFRGARVLPLLPRCEETGWFWDTEIMALCHAARLRITEVPCLFLRRSDKRSSVKPVRDSLDYFKTLLRFRARMARRPAREAQPDARCA